MLPAIPELDKPAGQPCKHLTAKGCGIYDSRPDVCRRFECNWLAGRGDDYARPDVVGAYVTPMAEGDGLSKKGGVMVHAEGSRFEQFVGMRRMLRGVVDAGQEVLIVAGASRRIITKDPAAKGLDVKDQEGRPVIVEVW